MTRAFPHLKLQTRMVLILGTIGLLQTVLIGVFAVHFLSQSLEEQMGERALHVARTIASVPEVISAVSRSDSDTLQPLALTFAETADARFVVIGDRNALRLAHPNEAMLRQSMVDDDDDDISPTLGQGRAVVTKALGSLGLSMRARAPIYDEWNQDVIGVVSVGYLLGQVDEVIREYRFTLIIVISLCLVLSVLMAIWMAKHFKRVIFGLEPEQIAQLFEERNATLGAIREGIVAINQAGIITTLNRAAIDTLHIQQGREAIGLPIQTVLPDSGMPSVLRKGKPQFDRDIWLNGMELIVNRVPIHDESGHVVGVVSSFRRKDELDQVSEQLTRIKQYAESLHSQAHEYSNKLHTIAGLIQIDAKEQALALIGQETQGYQDLIHLLVEAVPDPILAGCLLGKYNRARELGLELSVDSDSHMKDIPDWLPREQLVSIIGNLIDNALEATLAGNQEQGKVTLTMTDYGEDLIFEIEDQGSGIPEDQQERIFEKGVSSKALQGHGLGLFLVKRQLQQLHGLITVESLTEPSGSRFTVYIPKTLPNAAQQLDQENQGANSNNV